MEKYIGKMLDNRYEILEVIGTGGMAVVYKARCHRLNRFVAVKILKEDYARDADFRRRFHAESQAVAMLSHPNIVAVYDVSRSMETEYIVMELIDGITLKQYMQKKGVLNWRESLHFATQIVKALSHAHGRGIIHRDIKPHNIMILRDGSVKVADFGIARLASVQSTLTQEALGSVHYISPEQARGSHIDARSDLYSVGVVMYEMLTGRLPYEGESPVSVAIQHINSMPLSPREINPEVPEALEVITMKAMSASLVRRYTSAEAMMHDLEEFRKNPSISFDYDMSDMHPQEQMPGDEPTKPLVTGQSLSIQQPRELSHRFNKSSPPVLNEDDPEEEDYKRREKNGRVTILTGVLAVLVFVVGLVALIFLLIRSPDNTGENVLVPTLVGKRYEDVMDEAGSNEYINFIIDMGGEKNSDTYDAGVIMEQTPKAGDSVKKNTHITVTVSLGRRTLILPDYTNNNYREVQQGLSTLNLKYGEPEYEYSELVEGQVIATDPPAYAEVREGDIITLIVSLGPIQERVAVPNLVGKMDTEIERILLQRDLVLGSPITKVESDKPAGTVVWQSIEAGEEVDVKTVITVQVSLGPLDSPSPSESPTPSTPPTSPPPTESPSPTPEAKVTKTLNYQIKSTNETVWITIYVGNIMVKNEPVSSSIGNYIRQVEGYPSDLVDIYEDAVLKESIYISDIP